MELIAEQEPMIARALSVEEIFALDADKRYRYEMREKSIAHLRGVKKAGIREGIREGQKIGEKLGKEVERIAIARNLLTMGISLENIAQATKLPPDEIEKLRS